MPRLKLEAAPYTIDHERQKISNYYDDIGNVDGTLCANVAQPDPGSHGNIFRIEAAMLRTVKLY